MRDDARLRQDEDVLRTGTDVEASGSTPCATDVPQVYSASRSPPPHTAFFFNPLHETPMIRAFPPKGFNYPIPRTWPGMLSEPLPLVADQWRGATEEDKDSWRGFRVVTRAIAQQVEERQDLVEYPALFQRLPSTSKSCTPVSTTRFSTTRRALITTTSSRCLDSLPFAA